MGREGSPVIPPSPTFTPLLLLLFRRLPRSPTPTAPPHYPLLLPPPIVSLLLLRGTSPNLPSPIISLRSCRFIPFPNFLRSKLYQPPFSPINSPSFRHSIPLFPFRLLSPIPNLLPPIILLLHRHPRPPSPSILPPPITSLLQRFSPKIFFLPSHWSKSSLVLLASSFALRRVSPFPVPRCRFSGCPPLLSPPRCLVSGCPSYLRPISTTPFGPLHPNILPPLLPRNLRLIFRGPRP